MGRHPGGPQLNWEPRPGRRLAAAGVAALVALVAPAGCASGPRRGAAAPEAASSPPSSEPPPGGSDGAPGPPDVASSTTATTAPPTTTTVTAPPDGSLIPGLEGDAVRALQARLIALHYDPGPADGRYGGALGSAVMAFQKIAGKPRTGRASRDVLDALPVATDPPPLLPDGGATRMEVDLGRQVLLYWRDGALLRIVPISTGTGRHYCEDGDCGVAVTPSGSFRVERRIRGQHRSPLGLLFDPLFFTGGYAIHGSPSVPGYPASHGCIRIPLHVSGWFYDNVPDRTPVYVIGGRYPATPLPPEPPTGQAAPAPPPAPPS